jgi:hypothetical protein
LSTGQLQTRFESERPVVACAELAAEAIDELARRYRLSAVPVATGQPVPGSYWGAPEAGLTGRQLFWRPDTPVHSMLHELAHFVCMDAARRARLDTNAGGDDDEECAVCYLEILLAGQLRGFGLDRCIADMDAWGYSFREGSTRRWFEGDGSEARAWLLRRRLITPDGTPTWRLRT